MYKIPSLTSQFYMTSPKPQVIYLPLLLWFRTVLIGSIHSSTTLYHSDQKCIGCVQSFFNTITRNVYITDTPLDCTRCRHYKYHEASLKNATHAISKRNIFTTPNLYPFMSHPQFYIPRNTTYINNSSHTVHCIQQSLIIILIHEHLQIL